MDESRKHGMAGTLLALLLAAAGGAVVQAATVEVVVLDREGEPVPAVAVFVDQEGVSARASVAASAIMDQRDTQFVPHMLIVKKGTAVEFPNSDVVGHHVYSFSKPNNFVLPLYKGDPHHPVTFEEDGVVTLGCNIHDDMLGYIVVVNSDVFGITDEDGRVSLNVSDNAGRVVVNIWSPRIRDGESTLSKVVDGSPGTSSKLIFDLQKKLRAPHHSQSETVQWSDY